MSSLPQQRPVAAAKTPVDGTNQTAIVQDAAHQPEGAIDGLPRPLIFFDGVCGLCERSVGFVRSHDRALRFHFAPLQGETARAFLPAAAHQSLSSMVLVDNTGTYRRSDAIWRILVQLGGIWRLLGYGMAIIPRPLRNWGYEFVARHRYRVFGKKEACRIPTLEERKLFLP